MKNKQNIINVRIHTLLLICFFIIIFIISRLVFTQLLYGDYFANQGKKNFLRTEIIPCARGNILDRFGRILVSNRPIINLYWQGTGNRSFADDQITVQEEIEKLFNVSLDLPSIKKIERSHKKKLLVTDIAFEQLSTLLELIPHHPNVLLITEYKRYYPFKNHGAHILGYLNRPPSYETSGFAHAEQIGQMGLERYCELLLKGKEGLLTNTINSAGKKINTIFTEEPATGQNITITLNIDLQNICESIFPANHSGSILVMDPSEGDILALCSKPNFNPELFLEPISHNYWQELQVQNPFINRALSAALPPGSIFKLVTLSAALEQGLLSEDAIFDCKGYVDFCNRKYSCNKKTGHGKITVIQSIAQSCNDLFFKVGKTIDIDLLARYADLFGLGRPTSVILPEKTGLVPSRKWKLETKGERWWPGETLSVTIGQILTVTPLQVARMIGAIFTGFLVKPRVLLSEAIELEPCQIKEKTRSFLKKGMRGVVKKGTGRGVTKNINFKIYAKTSTAQTSTKNKRHLGKEFLEHGWFVAYFTFKKQKPLILVILIEHSGSAQVAKQVAQKFLIEYAKLMT